MGVRWALRGDEVGPEGRVAIEPSAFQEILGSDPPAPFCEGSEPRRVRQDGGCIPRLLSIPAARACPTMTHLGKPWVVPPLV